MRQSFPLIGTLSNEDENVDDDLWDPFAFWDGMAVFGGKTRDGTVTLINFVDDLVKSQAFWPWLFKGWMTQYVLLTF